MSIDGLSRNIGTTNYGGAENAGQTNTAGPAANLGTQTTDLNQLLNASKLLDGQNKLLNDVLKPPPEGVDSAKALSNLSSLDNTQVSADIYAFMALFQKLAQQMRDTARTQRTTDLQSQVTALQSAAEKMKDAAGERLQAAIVQGATQIAGGILQAGVSGASIGATVKGANLADGVGKKDIKSLFDGGSTGAAKWTSVGQNMTSSAQALGGIVSSSGTIAGATHTHSADLTDAEKMNLETQAKTHETGVQHANDMMQQMMDVIRDVREKLQSIQQSAIETNRGIARNI